MKAQCAFCYLLACFITSCTSPSGVPTRNKGIDFPNLWQRSYLEPTARKNFDYSCSFVELDGNGDFLLPEQLDQAAKRLKAVSKKPTILVFYCHGWRNNSQSSDVVRFCDFLHKLSVSAPLSGRFHIAGVYVSWRGAKFKPQIRPEQLELEHPEVVQDFGGQSIVQPDEPPSIPHFLRTPLELLTYWGRRNVAEGETSAIGLPTTIFSLTQLVKSSNSKSKVICIGHSFGAFMLEKCLLPSAISDVLQTPPSGQRVLGNLDLVVLYNSAAPSILAKQYRDLLDKHIESGPPLVISVTSQNDKATKMAHPLANSLAGLSERNAAHYVVKRGETDFTVPAEYFFQRTPGHNPFLITHEIIENTQSLRSQKPFNGDDVIRYNLNSATSSCFYTSNDEPENPPMEWRLAQRSAQSTFFSFKQRQIPTSRSRYWVIRCESPLVNDHGDIWSYRSVELTCALFRISQTEAGEGCKK